MGLRDSKMVLDATASMDGFSTVGVHRNGACVKIFPRPISRRADHIRAVEEIERAKETAENSDRCENKISPLGTPEAVSVEPARGNKITLRLVRRLAQLHFSLER
jgi:hypothetical protein